LGEAKARQVYLLLRDRILNGTLARDTRLPNENELARSHGVSRVTVRRALSELAREHLIERRPSAGTRVTYNPSSTPMIADIAGVLANLAEMGRETEVKLLQFDYLPGVPHVVTALGLSPGTIVQRSVRVRSLDRIPFSYLTTHVPEDIGRSFSKAELASGPILRLLERSGVKVERATQRIGATLAGPGVAQALGVTVGSPLIELTRVVFDRSGRGVEHLHALYRPDRYSLEIDLVRTGRSEGRNWTPAAADRRMSNRANAKSVN
jgi:GntR family transcriptional regulator